MKLLSGILLIVVFSLRVSAQSVVVNALYNAADPRDEWMELLVVNDNTDMRNWTMRDNNGNQQSWQTAVTFNNAAFWNNMRAGTIIMIWFRPYSSTGSLHGFDILKNDGYIELDATNLLFFNGGAFGTLPLLNGSTLNLASGGDIVQLRTASGAHVHAFGFKATTDSCWNNLPTPKLNHASSLVNDETVFACPGNLVGAYNGSSGTTLTAKGSTALTFGLPNSCGASATGNQTFWNTLRQPLFSTQTVNFTVLNSGSPGSATFSWTGTTDPYPADNMIGYIVLRNTSNSFLAPPSDGTTYSVGATIGGATVVGINTGSASTSFTDNAVYNGNTYYYRVYAFRYSADNLNGNSYAASRGRAYSETNFVSVLWSSASPLPVEFLSFTGIVKGVDVQLKWVTASEKENDHFILSRSSDGKQFSPIAEVKGCGTCTAQNEYRFTDKQVPPGLYYYALQQTDRDGVISAPLFVTARLTEHGAYPSFKAYPNPSDGVCFIETNGFSDADFRLNVFDVNGRKVCSNLKLNAGIQGTEQVTDLSMLESGTYVIELISATAIARTKFIRK